MYVLLGMYPTVYAMHTYNIIPKSIGIYIIEYQYSFI